MSVGLSVSLANRLPEIARLGGLLEGYCRDHGLPSKLCAEFTLALDEVLTNIISYGYPDPGEHTIIVRLAFEDGCLRAEVEDDGVPFNPLTAAEPDTAAPLEDRKIGGLGILIVKKLMDAVAYERAGGKNILILKKRVQK
jgi:anti-sigma regulatory factor (Ser/Thr protein kinase)